MSKIKPKFINLDPAVLEGNASDQLTIKDGVIPVKATAVEVGTGTDDAKFITPKALVDSGFVKVHKGTTAPTDTTALWIDTN